MADKTPHNQTPLDQFVAELADFMTACGPPSLRRLQSISKQLGQHYGSQYRNVPELTRTTLSAVLNRQRMKFPPAQWVTSFVLSCQRAAWESGITKEDPGPGSLPEWHKRLHAYRALDGRRSASASDPASVSSRDENTISDLENSPDVTVTNRPGEDRRFGPTLTQQRFHDAFGLYGLRLLAAAEDQHDPDAAYRIAVLLYLDHRPREAEAWLLQAHSDPDHYMATQLITADEPAHEATEHAYTLGAFAFAAGDCEVAEVYYERAACHGHVDAAFGLGVLFIEKKDAPRAARWFNTAAEGGHEYARNRFNDIHRVLLGHAFEAPLPADTVPSIDAPSVDDLRRAVNTPEETPPHGLPTVGQP
jgi:hypothetical protein